MAASGSGFVVRARRITAYSVEKLEIARTPDLDQLRMQSGMPSNHLRGHQPEVLHRDIDVTGYPRTYKEAPRPIGAAIFAAFPQMEFFNRIGQKQSFVLRSPWID